MVAEILCVGTELLMGQVLNSDAKYLAQELSRLGITLYHQTTVGDNPGRLRQAFRQAWERSDLVITTGGLGPTMDDLTKETIAEELGLPMERHEESYQKLLSFFQTGGRTMTPNNEKQAWFPKECIVLKNDRGTAPGCVIEQDGKSVVILPGPPRELTYVFEHEVLPYLQQKNNAYFHSINLRFFGIGESALEHTIRDIMEAQTNPTVAPYAGTGEVMLRVTASAATPEEAEALTVPMKGEILSRVGEFLYTDRYGSLAETLVREMADSGVTLAVAESCTGGMLSSQIVDISGSSAVLQGSVVSYSNAAKVDLLGVSPDTLTRWGAVSEQTALEMARGALERFHSDYALSTTGVAGPDGGTAEKPVGLVYVGMVGRNGAEQVLRLQISRDRNYVRSVTCLHAYNLLRKQVISDRNKV